MIRKSLSLAIVAAFMLCMASIALARGAPTREKAFSDQAIVSVHVAPTVANVPPMTTGFDVIQNITTAYPRLANVNNQDSDTSGTREQSTTVAERSYTGASYSARSGPNLAMVSRP